MLTRDEVIWGFRYILGRNPESETVISAHQHFPDYQRFREALFRSEEFRNAQKLINFSAEKWVCTEVYNGRYRLWIDLSDKYVSYGCLLDNYEPIETEFIRRNVKPGMVALDVGANIGWHTLGLAQLVTSSGKVYAFEPRKPTYFYLSRSVRKNGLDQSVILHDLALWDTAGDAHLVWPDGTENPGESFISDARCNYVAAPIKTAKLDDVVADSIDFIKIDIEGAEHRVLSSSKRVRSDRPIIVSEVHPTQLQCVSSVSADEYLAFFHRMDYRCFSLHPSSYGEELTGFGEGDKLFSVALVPSEKSVDLARD